MKQKRKDALQELLAKVEAHGSYETETDYDTVEVALSFTEHFKVMWVIEAWRDGSLDAALALHGAVLPGWQYGYDGIIAWVKMPGMRKRYSYGDPNGPAARAWLCAILQALVAECEP